jgi:hypothetical protein
MSDVMHSSFGKPEQRLATLKIHQNQAALWTAQFRSKFDFDLNTWKTNTLHNQGQGGAPQTPKPAVPKVVTVNVAKFDQRFNEYYDPFPPLNENGIPILQNLVADFYEFRDADLPEDIWDLTPAGPPPPEDPVAGPDQWKPGTYLVSQGDRYAPNDVITHPKYGRLRKDARPTPFGPVLRWVPA